VPASAPKPAKESSPPVAAGNKLSFMEKKEYEALTTDIENLEKEKANLTARLNEEQDQMQVIRLSEEIGRIAQRLDEQTMRWLELDEKSDKR
jgi:ATP-binding cassette subfamily F protein uup